MQSWDSGSLVPSFSKELSSMGLVPSAVPGTARTETPPPRKACRARESLVAGILGHVLHQCKQSLAESQILSPGPVYLTLESHLISRQALHMHMWVIYTFAFSSAPCASLVLLLPLSSGQLVLVFGDPD